MRSVFSTIAVAIGLAASGAAGAAAQPLTLSFEVGPVYFHRDAGNSVPLFRDGAVPVLSNTPADGLAATGGIATVTGMGAGWGFELRGILTPAASRSWRGTVNPTTDYVQFADGALFGMGGGGDFDLFADRTTSFRSLEANVLRAVDGIRLMLGVRAMRIGDTLAMTIGSVVAAPYAVHAGLAVDNRLVGPQFGVAGGGALSERVDLGGFARMGVLRDQATANFRTQVTDGPIDVDERWSDAATVWSLFAELGVDITFNPTERLSLFAGASVLFIDNVATTIATLGSTQFGAFGGTLSFEPAIYQLARIGLRFSF